MKLRYFFFITILTVFQVFASSNSNVNSDSDVNDCCFEENCTYDGCAYTYPFHQLECNFGFFVTGEYLYWFAKETDLVLTQKLVSQQIDDLITFIPLNTYYSFPTELISFRKNWDSGLRLGAGSISWCDKWDFYVNWTFFKNDTKSKALVNPIGTGAANDYLLNPWTNPLFGTDLHFDPLDLAFYGFSPLYTEIKGIWREKFNIIDGEIGRKFYLSRCMTLRPFFGVRGAWDRNRFNVSSLLEDREDGVISTNIVEYKNRFCGVGLVGGFQPNWYFFSLFSIFANADFALLWGRQEVARTEQNNGRLLDLENFNPLIPETSFKDHSMQAMLDLALGLRFESAFCCNRYQLGLDIGWEHHIWFSHNQRYQLRNGIGGLNRDTDFTEVAFLTTAFDFVCTDLSYGGLVVKGRFDF
ncbi:MAG: Lpg1974 family pore-forming outer membrane protein [Simkaniaceae bacterium]|nr:Lpg1974 family pore-forming outer membrane protein [Candidatus Sacchlamyda saccharinae]